MRTGAHLVLLALVPSVLAGCNLGRVAARSSAAVSRNGAPAMEQYFDYEIAGSAMPATIVQLESMIRSDPGNRTLLLSLTKTYVGYAYGWVEDEVEALEIEHGDYRRSAYERERAHRLYLRAKDLGLYLLALDAPSIAAEVTRGESSFRRLLAREFDDADDAAALFFTGSAWGSAIGTSESGISDSADIPFVRALVERAIELDPDVAHGMAYSLLGAVESSVPDGDPERARRYFETGLARTGRRHLAMLVQMANTYAVQTDDRALYVALLHEVLRAEDEAPRVRLTNLVAKRRARRYLDHVDSRFPQ